MTRWYNGTWEVSGLLFDNLQHARFHILFGMTLIASMTCFGVQVWKSMVFWRTLRSYPASPCFWFRLQVDKEDGVSPIFRTFYRDIKTSAGWDGDISSGGSWLTSKSNVGLYEVGTLPKTECGAEGVNEFDDKWRLVGQRSKKDHGIKLYLGLKTSLLSPPVAAWIPRKKRKCSRAKKGERNKEEWR